MVWKSERDFTLDGKYEESLKTGRQVVCFEAGAKTF